MRETERWKEEWKKMIQDTFLTAEAYKTNCLRENMSYQWQRPDLNAHPRDNLLRA